jgi:exopolyphosphatase/guanosine-5'-triphosphate,3'-diphosphate pyrophosphatase
VHLLGTSGTVTTIAGVRLGLDRYDRKRVDGIWLGASEIENVTDRLLELNYERRVLEPCIGRERADLVLAGCAILDAIMKLWPAERLRVADRGLREGILMRLMLEDGVWRAGRRRRARSRQPANGFQRER